MENSNSTENAIICDYCKKDKIKQYVDHDGLPYCSYDCLSNAGDLKKKNKRQKLLTAHIMAFYERFYIRPQQIRLAAKEAIALIEKSEREYMPNEEEKYPLKGCPWCSKKIEFA